MPRFSSEDPRAIRTRQAFQQAFMELLQVKSYQSISVTDIAQRAGFARHTFYNHYETKDDLLSNLIDSVLDDFYSGVGDWEFTHLDTEKELRMISSFFSVWKENNEVVQILNKLNVDDLLIKRLKAFFTKFYYEQVTEEIPGADFELAKYMINFNAYTLLGILKPWFQDEMKYTPEVMADFLIQLTGSSRRLQAVERFKGIFK